MARKFKSFSFWSKIKALPNSSGTSVTLWIFLLCKNKTGVVNVHRSFTMLETDSNRWMCVWQPEDRAAQQWRSQRFETNCDCYLRNWKAVIGETDNSHKNGINLNKFRRIAHRPIAGWQRWRWISLPAGAWRAGGWRWRSWRNIKWCSGSWWPGRPADRLRRGENNRVS